MTRKDLNSEIMNKEKEKKKRETSRQVEEKKTVIKKETAKRSVVSVIEREREEEWRSLCKRKKGERVVNEIKRDGEKVRE